VRQRERERDNVQDPHDRYGATHMQTHPKEVQMLNRRKSVTTVQQESNNSVTPV
jgi:hypothetical protein